MKTVANRMTNASPKVKRLGVDGQRQVIIQTAINLLNKGDSQNVSVSKICEEAEISRPTFYRCYKDINALMSDLYEQGVNTYTEEMILSIFDVNIEDPDVFKANIEKLLDAIFENSDVANIIFSDANNPNTPAYQVVSEAFDQIIDVIFTSLRLKKAADMHSYLKAILYATQWIAHEAIILGLSDANKANAKRAVWHLVNNAILPLMKKQD